MQLSGIVSAAFIASNDTLAWARVGRCVLDRRQQLGVGQREAGLRSGVGQTVWNRLEGGKQDRYRRTSINRVEKYLSWEAGSVEALLANGPAPTVTTPTDFDLSDFAALKRHVEEQDAQLRELRETVSDLLGVLSRAPRLRK